MSRTRAVILAVVGILGVFGAAGIRIPLPPPSAEPIRPADEPLALVLNLPAFRLDVYEEGRRTHSFHVAVGARGHETPTGEYRISRAVWNPWWHPPDSPWAKNEKVTPPGPSNPMGRVKLFFEGLYYIHGTPLTGELGQPASHGCIRMRNTDVIALARLVHRYTTPEVTEERLAALEADPKKTTTIALGGGVPLSVVYRLAELRDGHLVMYPDVYRLRSAGARAEAVAALAEAGFDAGELDAGRLDELAARSGRELVVVRADELLAGRATVAQPEGGGSD